jgi:ABC-type sugar transport system substrate-binding protein
VTDRRYAVNVARREQPFFLEVTGTAKRIGTTVPGVEVLIGGPLDADSNRQIAELESLIARKVSGIMVFPADSVKLAAVINKAVAKGIGVVTIFSDVLDSDRLTMVGAPNRQSGRLMAERVFNEARVLAAKTTKVLVSYNKPGEHVTDERLDGIRDAVANLKYEGKIQIVDVVNDDGRVAEGTRVIAAALKRHKRIDVIFGLNARSAVGAMAALKQSRKNGGAPYKAGEVIVTGWDSEDAVLEGIQSVWIRSTSVLNRSLCTQIGFGILEAQTLGYLYPEGLRLRELAFPAVPKEILIAETVVDRLNVDGYLRLGKHSNATPATG